MDIENILQTYGIVLIGIIIVKILYFLVLLCKVWDTASETIRTEKELQEIKENQEKEIQNQKYIIKQLVEENKKLERIAKVLEQDSDPYIIEDKEEDS